MTVPTSKTIHLVTAVSRPQNLLRMYNSIKCSISKTKLQAEWILVADRWADLFIMTDPIVANVLKHSQIKVVQTVGSGSKCQYGIAQKNIGMNLIREGYFHCLDDDNIVHPNFFKGIEREVLSGSKAICFNQRRWDMLGTLVADPKKMGYGQIDNTMFVVDIDLISHRRYSLADAGKEDWLFFSGLHEEYHNEFVFVKETLAYYNYIHIFPVEPEPKFDEVPR